MEQPTLSPDALPTVRLLFDEIRRYPIERFTEPNQPARTTVSWFYFRTGIHSPEGHELVFIRVPDQPHWDNFALLSDGERIQRTLSLDDPKSLRILSELLNRAS